MKTSLKFGVLTTLLASLAALQGEPAPVPISTDDAQTDMQAEKMLQKGRALLEERQEERGIKIIAAVPLTFPKSPVRFKAVLLMANHYIGKNDFQLAIKTLGTVLDSKEAGPDELAEALYRVGIAYYGLADYNRALTTLRRVTESYPWSIFANESYYYIGLCHFKMNRWRKAVDALKLVGTSVPPNTKSQNKIEGGQRFFVKINDKDLRMLMLDRKTLNVKITTTGAGDTEIIPMSIFDAEGEYYFGSIKTDLGLAKANDGVLQFVGGDTITVEYVDANTQEGQTGVPLGAKSRVVSTAAAGFMDGALREYVYGVIAGQPTFLRVKDFDADTSNEKDQVRVRLYTQYRPAPDEETAPRAGGDAEPEWIVRDSLEFQLSETGPHTGFFAGQLTIGETSPSNEVNKADAKLEACDKDVICLEYVDGEHIGGGTNDSRTIVAKAEFVAGQIQDVYIAHREISAEDMRAKKNHIEAKFYLRLAEIFRDVGLQTRAIDKAEVGLDKVNDILRRALKVSINQDLIEDTYRIKWELQLVKGDLGGAIQTCQTLMALYPNSALADVALMQIAKARLEAKQPKEAIQILNGILRLKASNEIKAEVQFLLGSILENEAIARTAKQGGGQSKTQAMGPAIEAFRVCAEKYPQSTFAGQALGKVIDYYIETKEYDRCQELLQQVFTDYPDASFLDEMLLKWGLVLARKGVYQEARLKLQQLLSEYPNSASAGKATKLMEMINKKAENS